MAGRSKWSNMKRDASREQAEEVERQMQADMEEMLSVQVRKLMGMTVSEGVDEPECPGPKHPEVDDDVWVGTLRGIVEELGGELEIVLKVPTGRIVVNPSQRMKPAAPAPAPAARKEPVAAAGSAT